MRNARNTLAVLFLLAGIVWSLPMQPGRDDAEAEPAAYSAVDPAAFEITSYRGTLRLTGHTSSQGHEQRLKLAAAEYSADLDAQFEFRSLGVAPDWWDEATVELLGSLASIESPSASLRQDGLHIRGVVADKTVADAQLRALRKVLPTGADIDVQLMEIDTGVSAAALCERRFAALQPGAVRFEESGTRMRASAYPVLDRIVALADACRDSTISITGHTDSTGSEAWNKRLSLARARAVADYLENSGIDAQRLKVVGAGSSFPVANNATRYGRSINRRIEIHLESTR